MRGLDLGSFNLTRQSCVLSCKVFCNQVVYTGRFLPNNHYRSLAWTSVESEMLDFSVQFLEWKEQIRFRNRLTFNIWCGDRQYLSLPYRRDGKLVD